MDEFVSSQNWQMLANPVAPSPATVSNNSEQNDLSPDDYDIGEMVTIGPRRVRARARRRRLMALDLGSIAPRRCHSWQWSTLMSPKTPSSATPKSIECCGIGSLKIQRSMAKKHDRALIQDAPEALGPSSEGPDEVER